MKHAPGRVSRVRKRALDVLGRLGPIDAERFAEEMWPRAKAWSEPSSMREAGNSVLGALVKDGFACKTSLGYMLNAAGLDLRDRLFPIA